MKRFLILLCFVALCSAVNRFCSSTSATASADPVFHGFHDQQFVFAGRNGGIYHLYSDSSLSVNTKFGFAYEVKHKGTVMKQIAIKTSSMNVLLTNSSFSANATVEIMIGKERVVLKNGESKDLSSCISVSVDHGKFKLTTPLHYIIVQRLEAHNGHIDTDYLDVTFIEYANEGVLGGLIGQTEDQKKQISINETLFNCSSLFSTDSRDNQFANKTLQCEAKRDNKRERSHRLRDAVCNSNSYCVLTGASTYGCEVTPCTSTNNLCGTNMMCVNGDCVQRTCGQDSDCGTGYYCNFDFIAPTGLCNIPCNGAAGCCDSSSDCALYEFCSAEQRCDVYGCFLPETPVVKSDGTEVQASTIQFGDYLQGLNGPSKVLLIVQHPIGKNTLVSINGKNPYFTIDHPFYSPTLNKVVSGIPDSDLKALISLTDSSPFEYANWNSSDAALSANYAQYDIGSSLESYNPTTGAKLSFRISSIVQSLVPETTTVMDFVTMEADGNMFYVADRMFAGYTKAATMQSILSSQMNLYALKSYHDQLYNGYVEFNKTNPTPLLNYALAVRSLLSSTVQQTLNQATFTTDNANVDKWIPEVLAFDIYATTDNLYLTAALEKNVLDFLIFVDPTDAKSFMDGSLASAVSNGLSQITDAQITQALSSQ